ncbi:hypothetical protein [Lacinutrix jangbogonensis]|uniref:hypothetical protein n=1 Tax=Lacinutrix jangbogonensis TaxID=1469557 RepID=UPI00053D4564|nr:hypothetical protein [Lacinutrix jangbogonensis]
MGFNFTDTPEELKTKYKNSIEKGDTYSIFIGPTKYPNLIFKVFYSNNEISQISFMSLNAKE